jgi:hypothetical protein
MSYKIIDNALNKKDFLLIQENLMGDNFPWYFQKNVAYKDELAEDFFFGHLFYINHTVTSQSMALLEPILNILNPKALIRIKANLYPNLNKNIFNGSHVDFPFSHLGALFYINTNNGFTILEDKTKIESIENRLLLFDSSKPHQSTHCTDQKVRININFNYF